MDDLYKDSIPFSYLVDLVHTVGAVPPRAAGRSSPTTSRQLDCLTKWILHLRKCYPQLPHGTVKLFFRLFFVDESVRRR